MDLKRAHIRFMFVLIMLVAALFVIQPYIITILLAGIIAYLLWPIHIKLKDKISNSVSALTLTCLTVLILLLAIYYGIYILVDEAANFYLYLSQINVAYFGSAIQEVAKSISTKLISTISDQIVTLVNIILSSVIFFVSLFYFLKEGEQFQKLSEILPFEKVHRQKIVKNITQYLDAFVHVQIVIGILQGIVAGLGFWFFGLQYPVLAGVAAAVLSILPAIGPYILYVPIAIMTYYTHGASVALGILIYGLAIGSILDYIVRPIFYGKKIKLHPIITFLGIFGGMRLFGFVGIIIGPIILSIAIAMFKELKIDNG
jgi:predicted PurR-regulated permease PerM